VNLSITTAKKLPIKLPPLSLYIHIPWCVKKCPYCDFNSHNLPNNLNQEQYINALILDLKHDLTYINNNIKDNINNINKRKLISIFIGGGTPSLFDAKYIDLLLTNINKLIAFDNNIEITLEANPATFNINNFIDYNKAGINRLSIGVQSFNNKHLNALGRIHNKDCAVNTIKLAQNIFNNINLDLMFGLPNQTLKDGLNDLNLAINLNVNHISWYQLTIEPNTLFYKLKPNLPNDDYIFKLYKQGHKLLFNNNFYQYEISAYAKTHNNINSNISSNINSNINYQAQHNLNYWQFGDYLGIGAGAHGKITLANGQIMRTIKKRSPKNYLTNLNNFIANKFIIKNNDLPFEFLLNALRLNNGVNKQLFIDRTNLPLNTITNNYNKAIKLGLLQNHPTKIITTNKGKLFLNDLLQLFLNDF